MEAAADELSQELSDYFRTIGEFAELSDSEDDGKAGSRHGHTATPFASADGAAPFHAQDPERSISILATPAAAGTVALEVTPTAAAAGVGTGPGVGTAARADAKHLARADDPRIPALERVYRNALPQFIIKRNADRADATLRALAARNVTPNTLAWAVGMGRLRDGLAQFVSSLAGYGSSFVVYNTMLLYLTAPPEGSGSDAVHRAPTMGEVSLAALAMVASAIPVQRILRVGEMLPGFTAAVEESEDGKSVVPMLDTLKGRLKVLVQYWPFFGSLLSATFLEHDPQSRLLARRVWGTFATLGVGAHRFLGFNRDLPWLDGRTEQSTQVMMQHIHELTDVRSSLEAAVAYCLRPLAGFVGMIGIDAITPVEVLRSGDLLARQPAPPAPATPDGKARPWPPVRELSPGLDAPFTPGVDHWRELAHLLARATCILVPILVLEAVTANVNAETHVPWRQGVASDGFLILTWGMGMLANEMLVRANAGIARENTTRAAQGTAWMHAKYKDRHPDPDPDGNPPQGGGAV